MIGRLRAGLRPLERAGRNFWRDRDFDHAATIAFYWVVSLGPCLYLLFVGLTMVLGESEAKGAAFTGAAGFFPPTVAPTVVHLEESLALGKPLALVAIPALLWTASSAFAAVEYGVNEAFRTTAQRRFWGSRLKAFAGSAFAAVLLGTSVALVQLSGALARVGTALGLHGVIERETVAVWIRLALTFGSFAFLFKLLPRGWVSPAAAAKAAGFSTLLWEAARRLFGLVLSKSPGFGLLTGSLAGMVGFLLWSFTAAAVVLFGAQIAAVLNGNRPDST